MIQISQSAADGIADVLQTTASNGTVVQMTLLEIFNKLAAESRDGVVPLPLMLRALVATAVNPVLDAPVCIILPDVEGIPEIVAAVSALVILREDWPSLEETFIKDVLRPGIQLRSVKEGKIIGFRSIDQDYVCLHYVDAEGSKTNATLTVPKNIVFGFEPTERKRPIFKSGEKPLKPSPTPFDHAAGTRTFGNTRMIRNRIIMLGLRQQFEETLSEAAIILARDRDNDRIRAFENFVWGYIDEARRAVVTHPHGTTGDPLVAVTQDALLLEGPRTSAEESIRILVSGRFELVRRNLEIVQRFAERNRVLVLAPAARREEAMKLRDSGWSVWEPRGWELRVPDSGASFTGLPGLSRSLCSLSADLRPLSFTIMPVCSTKLRNAFDHVSAIGNALPVEDSGMDQRLDEMRIVSSNLLFSMAALLQAPTQEEIEYIQKLTLTLKNHHRHVERCLGPATAEHIAMLLDSSNGFLAEVDVPSITPKGEALLKLARNASNDPRLPHAFVAGSARDRDRLIRFLEVNNETRHPCLTVQELHETSRPFRIVAFGLVRREAFALFVDPWPAGEITVTGYDFEIDIYERRLRHRERMRDRLALDETPRSRVTGLSSGEFGKGKRDEVANPIYVDAKTPEPPDATLSGFDRAVGNRRGAHGRPVMNRKPGETVVKARYMTFCGTSWAAFTEEHEILAVRGSIGSTSSIVEMEVPDLVAGTRIIIRESGDKDVIREMAEGEIGERTYVSLRDRAALWRRAIRRSDLAPQEIARHLARVGVNRSLATIRGWVSSESRIGPRSKMDVLGIAEAFPFDGANERAWEDCAAAIAEVRGLHLSVGSKLTGILATQCQNVLIDAAEHEQRVELDFGAVWIVEIAEIDDGLSEWPISSVNRLNRVERRASAIDVDELLGTL